MQIARIPTYIDTLELSHIDDVIECIVSYRSSVAAVGFDRQYSVTDKLNLFRALAVLTECDALDDIADNIAADLEPFDALAHYGDMSRKLQQELSL